MVADERRARAALEDRVGLLERRDEEKRARVERLEGAVRRIERVRSVLGVKERKAVVGVVGGEGEDERLEVDGVERRAREGGEKEEGDEEEGSGTGTEINTDTDTDTDAEAERGSEREWEDRKDIVKKQAKTHDSDEARQQDQHQHPHQHVQAADGDTKEEG